MVSFKLKGETAKIGSLNIAISLLCMAFTLSLLYGCATQKTVPTVFHVQVEINDLNGDRIYNSVCPNGCWWDSTTNSYQ